MKRIFLFIICAAAILLDMVVPPAPFPHIPIALFTACLALAAWQPIGYSLGLAAVGGLVLDLLRNTALGLTPAFYILAALAFSLVYRKNNKRAHIYMSVAGALFFAIHFLYAAAASLVGRTQPYLRILMLQCLPVSFLAALLCHMLCGLFERLSVERRRI